MTQREELIYGLCGPIVAHRQKPSLYSHLLLGRDVVHKEENNVRRVMKCSSEKTKTVCITS